MKIDFNAVHADGTYVTRVRGAEPIVGARMPLDDEEGTYCDAIVEDVVTGHEGSRLIILRPVDKTWRHYECVDTQARKDRKSSAKEVLDFMEAFDGTVQKLLAERDALREKSSRMRRVAPQMFELLKAVLEQGSWCQGDKGTLPAIWELRDYVDYGGVMPKPYDPNKEHPSPSQRAKNSYEPYHTHINAYPEEPIEHQTGVPEID